MEDPRKTYLKLKVHAGAKDNRLQQHGQERFEIWVKEPAEGGRANRAVLELLSRHLGVETGKLWLIKGAHSPAKIVQVRS
jgi:hypothetical protein